MAFSFPFDFGFGVGVSGDSDDLEDGMSDVVAFSTLADCMGPGLVAVNRGRPRLSDLPDKKYLRPCEADDVADGAAPMNTGVFPSSIAENFISTLDHLTLKTKLYTCSVSRNDTGCSFWVAECLVKTREEGSAECLDACLLLA